MGAIGPGGPEGGVTKINLTDYKTLAVGDVTKDKVLVIRLLDAANLVIAKT